ncbi:MAG: B12-binding domain-containing radical SAM protein [Deltaproteobacteria bacterium]|jgi:radical SAM superfamily enzyme YgiQ (UPF0313 family)|nr:B12-binding domain-containing radical SAM protein [Deltaproteobacteria bacterium]MBW2533402.1 B12-binding domain-containing radical SAM protein [Deltaproteobacteria bacterium]
MQLELISPASEDSTYLPRYGLGILAAQTPKHVEVIYTDDVIRRIDLDRDVKDVDLVGISVDSKTARRAYDIADGYRRRGVAVVLGGIHPTALPEEAAAHADSVVVGEADTVWREVIGDFQRGELRPIYRPPLPDLADMPMARRDLFKSIKYIPYQVVQTMRGCPYPCEFCSVSTQSGKTFRHRPVDHVIAELEQLDRMILFADDNIMIDRAASEPLFRAMAPLEKHWIGQCSLAAVEKIDNVELMAKSGCKALFIGLESVDQETMRPTAKPQNKVSRYRDIVSTLRDCGIAVWGSFVFGFDTDDGSVFDRTVEAAIDMKMTMASFALLTPYPGTRLYERLRHEGRLTDETWWLGTDHDAGSPYYRPAKMTRTELREGWARAWRSFYTPKSMWRRFTLKGAFNPIQAIGFWPLNAMQHRLAHSKITGGVQRHRTR